MLQKITACLMSIISIFSLWNVSAEPSCFRVKVIRAAFALEGLTQLGGKTDGLLILQGGEIIHEEYPSDEYDAETPHEVHSVTKSFISALIGIAIGEGLIGGTEDKVIRYFPEAEALLPAGQVWKRDMTITHLLTMTSGIAFGGNQENWNAVFEHSDDSALSVFLLPQSDAPGAKFTYDDMPAQILAGIIERQSKMTLMEYAQSRLFGPLGITVTKWYTAADGLPYGGYGLFLTPRDMAKFGQLFLNNGVWEGKQIVPARWVEQSIPQTCNPFMGYGQLWWNAMLSPFDNAYEARGYYGQFITVLPKHDLVIVRTGSPGKLELGIEKLLSQLGFFPEDTGGAQERFWPEYTK